MKIKLQKFESKQDRSQNLQQGRRLLKRCKVLFECYSNECQMSIKCWLLESGRKLNTKHSNGQGTNHLIKTTSLNRNVSYRLIKPPQNRVAKEEKHQRDYSTKALTLLNPGSMLPESTTTTGDSLPVIHMSPFHIISADVTIIPEKRM